MKLVPLMKLVLYMVAMAVEQRSNSFRENSLTRKIELRILGCGLFFLDVRFAGKDGMLVKVNVSVMLLLTNNPQPIISRDYSRERVARGRGIYIIMFTL